VKGRSVGMTNEQEHKARKLLISFCYILNKVSKSMDEMPDEWLAKWNETEDLLRELGDL